MNATATTALVTISCFLGMMTGIALSAWPGIRHELSRIADALERGHRLTDLSRR